jgi:uncharacterized protein YecA (UPF0149 family)
MQFDRSPDSATIQHANLSPAQAQVVAALAQGRTVTTAAQDAGLHRNTIYNWLHEPESVTAPSVSAGAPSSPPIARCAPCPCGSGLKYKRCCGSASPGKSTPPHTSQGAAA